MACKLVEQELRAVATDMRDDGIERFQPLGGFLRIRIRLLRAFNALWIG